MTLAAAGGLLNDGPLRTLLARHGGLLTGSVYQLQTESFSEPQPGIRFIAEHLTHNYHSLFADLDTFADWSNSVKSKYTVNDFAQKYQRPSAFIIHNDGWKLVRTAPGSGCLECALGAYQVPEPYFLWPEFQLAFAESAADILESPWNSSTVINLENHEETVIARKADCQACGGNFRFLNGDMADVVSVSCSDLSVAVSPMNQFTLDLNVMEQKLKKNFQILQKNAFFVSFKVDRLECILFRQGRLITKNTKEKNTGVELYRLAVGN